MEFSLGGLATMSAALFTNPIEVVKTRMQIQGELSNLTYEQKIYRNPFQAFLLIGRTEGIKGLQSGLGPAVLYQLTMNGTRLGLYEPIKRLLNGDVHSSPHPIKNVIAGSTSGVLAAIIGSPFFLIKVRLQTQASGSSIAATKTVGYQHHYKGAISGLHEIWKSEGIRGLYRGVSAAMLRVGIGSGVQLSTYDACKSFVVSTCSSSPYLSSIFSSTSVSTHFAASLIAGFFVTLAMNPPDVLSTRMYNQPVVGSQNQLYSNVFDCAYKIISKEGIFALYKGFFAHYLRLGPHTILTFVFWEQLKAAATKVGV